MIQDLIELVDIVTTKKVHQIEILTEESDLNTKSKILLDGIRSGSIRTDEDAHQLIYKEGDNKLAFSKLKSRLFNRLLNTLFFIDVKKTGKRADGGLRRDSYKKYCQIMIIYEEGNQSLAARLAKKLADQIKGLEMHNLEILLFSFLNEHYTIWEKSPQKASAYYKKLEEATNAVILLQKITPLWIELGNHLVSKKAQGLSADQKVNYQERIAEIEEAFHDGFSFLAKSRFFYSKYFYLWLTGDFEDQLAVCDKALGYIDLPDAVYTVPIITFKIYRGITLMNLLRYHEADQSFYRILEEYKFTPGKMHWYNLYNYHFLVKIILGSYDEALGILNDVIRVKGFKKMDPKWREPWLIKEAYMNILLKMGKLEMTDENALRPFRLRKFMNTVSHFYKDKSGLNVSAIIAQFLFLLVDGKADDLYDKLDSLKQYRHRYLRNDPALRSKIFVKMLMTLPKAHFHPAGVKPRVEELWEKLQNTPMMIGSQSYEVEIIPYEHLWGLVMEILENRVKK